METSQCPNPLLQLKETKHEYGYLPSRVDSTGSDRTGRYYEMAIRQIDTHIEQFGNLIDEKVCDDLFIVKEQLVKFISDIKIQLNLIISRH